MRFRTLALLIIVALAAAFVALNWTTFITSTYLSLGFAEVQAPLGLILLTFTVLLVVVFSSYLVYQQRAAARESARQT